MGVNIEIERKDIAHKPDIELLRMQKNFTESQIVQTYLRSESGETRRVRCRRYSDRTQYTETSKIRIDAMSVTEIEREIDVQEYERLCLDIADGTRPVEKSRYTFEYLGQIFELDFYPRWERSCILETEMESRDCVVKFPEFIEIIREVTGDKRYSNAAMSRAFPAEDNAQTSDNDK